MLHVTQCMQVADTVAAFAAGAIVGSLICVDSLSQVQHDTYEQATVLYVKHIGGEEDIPQVNKHPNKTALCVS